ncbi:MAG: hypothetical protein R3B72_18200 [Polyangiaceae bacterium]
MNRRRFLLAAATATIPTQAFPKQASAMGRVPVGGDVALRVPWSTGRIDPHDLHDPMAAFFGPAIADTVYLREASGRVYPALADGMPIEEGDETLVTLRPGLVSARGMAISGRDLAWSTARAKRLGASGLLAPLDPMIRSDPERPLIARFKGVPADRLALLLTSPLCALLPVGYSPTEPDGTGPFRATCTSQQLVLERNENASRGPAFLEKVAVRRASDLTDSLSAFEAAQDDLGWLGLGFHRDRPKSRRFDFREAGWVILATGRNAGRFAAPGMAQKLANGVGVGRLHVGLHGISGPSITWDGGATELLYDSDCSHLGAVAEAVAAKLSSSGHEVRPRPLSRARLRSARTAESYALALDLVRDPGAVPGGESIALATADKPDIARQRGLTPSTLLGTAATAALRVGIIGSLRIEGGVASEIILAAHPSGKGFDWGASYRRPA